MGKFQVSASVTYIMLLPIQQLPMDLLPKHQIKIFLKQNRTFQAMRKKIKDNWMPLRVYRGKSAYKYRPISGGCIRLCKLTATKATVWIEYEKAQITTTDKNTVSFLIDSYIKDDHFKNELRPATQRDYLDCKVRVEDVFGKMRYVDVKPIHIKKFLRFRGEESKSRANRERTFLYNVMAWAYEECLITINPCKGVKPFKLKARDRYVTDDEYKIVYNLAPTNIQSVMEIAYLCAARSGDVRLLKHSDIKPEGLLIVQSKTGKKQIKKWTSRLKKAVDTAKEQPAKIASIYVIHNRHGQPYTAKGLKGMFVKLVDKAMGICREVKGEKHYLTRKAEFEQQYPPLIKERFSLHDLKAKGISDFEGDKQFFSGHKTSSMVERYNRTPDIVDILAPESSEKDSE